MLSGGLAVTEEPHGARINGSGHQPRPPAENSPSMWDVETLKRIILREDPVLTPDDVVTLCRDPDAVVRSPGAGHVGPALRELHSCIADLRSALRSAIDEMHPGAECFANTERASVAPLS
jgi:hypothetical protein